MKVDRAKAIKVKALKAATAAQHAAKALDAYFDVRVACGDPINRATDSGCLLAEQLREEASFIRLKFKP